MNTLWGESKDWETQKHKHLFFCANHSEDHNRLPVPRSKQALFKALAGFGTHIKLVQLSDSLVRVSRRVERDWKKRVHVSWPRRCSKWPSLARTPKRVHKHQQQKQQQHQQQQQGSKPAAARAAATTQNRDRSDHEMRQPKEREKRRERG